MPIVLRFQEIIFMSILIIFIRFVLVKGVLGKPLLSEAGFKQQYFNEYMDDYKYGFLKS